MTDSSPEYQSLSSSDEESETENAKRKQVQKQYQEQSTAFIEDLWVNTFSRNTTEGRYYKVPEQLSLTNSISILKKDLHFPNIWSLFCCKSIHSLCHFLVVTVSDGLSCIYTISDDISEMNELIEFLVYKRHKFILYDSYHSSPLKQILKDLNCYIFVFYTLNILYT